MINKTPTQEDVKTEECKIEIQKVDEVNVNRDSGTQNKDKLCNKDNVKDSIIIKEDTVIDIEGTEDYMSTVIDKKNNVYSEYRVYSQYFTKHLWHKGHHRTTPFGKNHVDVWTQNGGGGFYSGDDNQGEPLMYDPESRNSFVCLVMIITLIMLLLTGGFVAYVFNTPSVRRFFRRNGLLIMIGSLVLYMIPSYGMVFIRAFRRLPCSIFMLILAVISMCGMTAYVTCRYRTDIVVMAIAATAAIVFFCIILACTSFDFTQFYLYLVVIGLAFAVVSIMLLGYTLVTGEKLTLIRVILLIVGVIFQSVLLVMELQMILGGRAIELEEDDYALGAFMLYTSIIDLFLKLVQILGFFND